MQPRGRVSSLLLGATLLLAAALPALSSAEEKPKGRNPDGEYNRAMAERFKSLAGREYSQRDVVRELAKLPDLGKPNRVESIETDKEGVAWKKVIVRTGTENGQPKGYIRYSQAGPADVKTTVFLGTGGAWVRTEGGGASSGMALRRETLANKAGRTLVESGKATLFTNERAESGTRFTQRTVWRDGTARAQTSTRLDDGRKEHYVFEEPAGGRPHELLIREQASGQRISTAKSLDADGNVHIVEQRSNGEAKEPPKERTLSREQSQRLFQRLAKAAQDPQGELVQQLTGQPSLGPAGKVSAYPGGYWKYREQAAGSGNLQVIRARGQGSKLGVVESGRVSMFGTYHGALAEHVSDVFENKPKGSRPDRTEYLTRRDPLAAAAAKTRGQGRPSGKGPAARSELQRDDAGAKGEPTGADLAAYPNLQRALQIVERGTGVKVKAIIDNSEGKDNAFYNSGEPANWVHVGEVQARGPIADLVLTLDHELGHAKDPEGNSPGFYDPFFRAEVLQAGGNVLGARVAFLRFADRSRADELRADYAAGFDLGRYQRVTGVHIPTKVYKHVLKKADPGKNPFATHPQTSERKRAVDQGVRDGAAEPAAPSPLAAPSP